MRQDFMEKAVKGWIAYAMEFRGYSAWEIRAVMESAYRYQYGTDGIAAEDAVNQYRYYCPKEETRLVVEQEERLLAAREAAV